MLSRRDFLQVTAAAAALGTTFDLKRAAARQAITQEGLLGFKPVGSLTLLHFTDLHAQLMPIYFREPSVNIGVGDAAGLPPHLTGTHLLARFGIAAGSPEAYAFTSADYLALARDYGRVGGIDRMATLIRAIRAERPNLLLLDGGDSWQGSYTALRERGADMVRVQNALEIDATTAHWEFTYGAARVRELLGELRAPFLCGNVKSEPWGDPVFESTRMFERGGLCIAVIGQAFPYTPIANPAWLIPDWRFDIDDAGLQQRVDKARQDGADLVVLLSHNGFDVDRKQAARVHGIDVILGGHTHDGVPAPTMVGTTLIIASGSHGKFLSRLDLEVRGRKIADYAYRLIPVFADAIAPDPAMAELVAAIRRPHHAALDRVLGHTEGLLYRRGNFNGTFDDLIGQALLAERDAEIALSPGFRWGATLLPGQPIRLEDVYNQTAITYPAAYRRRMTGAELKYVLEDVADNLFNPDPYYTQGGDMVRVAGMRYTIDVGRPMGQRISDMRLLRNDKPIEPHRRYVVAGWASVRQGTEGPPIFDLVSSYIAGRGVVKIAEPHGVRVLGADPRGMSG
ncbi:MAG TPA: thiosulfohydrolase SoxB [Candidatus Sulfotelmatobacter sp.]|nr:thiosulfohydrolase SoxB [Candidatus Sulfotelmatobacter sp.]